MYTNIKIRVQSFCTRFMTYKSAPMTFRDRLERQPRRKNFLWPSVRWLPDCGILTYSQSINQSVPLLRCRGRQWKASNLPTAYKPSADVLTANSPRHLARIQSNAIINGPAPVDATLVTSRSSGIAIGRFGDRQTNKTDPRNGESSGRG